MTAFSQHGQRQALSPVHQGRRRRLIGAVVACSAVLGLASEAPALADRPPYPHEFHRNMGYCAPFLAQQRLPDGSPVRPFINHIIQDLTAGDSAFEGQKNLGDLYSDRARSTTDQNCLPRQSPPPTATE